jgi:hypothetical protein
MIEEERGKCRSSMIDRSIDDRRGKRKEGRKREEGSREVLSVI